MTLHTKLLRSYFALGYPETTGICHGFSIRWLEASILNQGDTFNRRLKNIIDGGTWLTNFLHKAEKRKWEHIREDKKQRLLDIRAFLIVCLYFTGLTTMFHCLAHP